MSQPMEVEDVVAKWTTRQKKNSRWSDEDRVAMAAAVAVIGGKRKEKAVEALEAFRDSHDPHSQCASFARVMLNELTFMEETEHEQSKQPVNRYWLA